jgi:putative Mn2+ efflux pump MntP
MLATVAAFLAIYYGATMAQNRYVRLLVTAIFIGAFVTAAIAGLYGALITKVAPVT